MRTILKGKNTDLTAPLRTYIDEKITKSAKKYLGKRDDGEAVILELEVGRVTNRHRKGSVWYAEANLSLGGVMLRASHEGEDAHEVIDLVEEELLREIKKFKEKNQTSNIRGARKAKGMMRKER